jgi:hypothetical protein
MARIRTIKPDFFIDDDIAALHPLTRILFIGLWCLADKGGRLEDKPNRIKIQLLPYDKHDINAALNDLVNTGLIIRYEAEGQKIIQIRSFDKHQVTHHTEKESTLPLYNGEITVKDPLSNGEITVPSPVGREYNIREGKGSRTTQRAAKISIPDNFKISDKVKAWAASKSLNHLDQHLESFICKCKARGYKYMDWDAAFMEAIRGDWAGISSKDPPQDTGKRHSTPVHLLPSQDEELRQFNEQWDKDHP